MARSHAIWLVLNQGLPVAAFTVKHEFETWWKRQQESVQRQLDVWRLPDGTINASLGPGPFHIKIAHVREEGCDGRCEECYPVSALDGEPPLKPENQPEPEPPPPPEVVEEAIVWVERGGKQL